MKDWILQSSCCTAWMPYEAAVSKHVKNLPHTGFGAVMRRDSCVDFGATA